MKNLILLSGILLFTITGFAQSDKMLKKAKQKADDINAAIVSVDPGLALTEDQKAKIISIQLERFKELKVLKETQPDNEKRKELAKPVNKKYAKQINKEVLSKPQFKAYQKGKNLKKNK